MQPTSSLRIAATVGALAMGVTLSGYDQPGWPVLTMPAWAETGTPYVLDGYATPVDGDELRLRVSDGGEFAVRLDGIDAPERGMRCGEWPAGQVAYEHLVKLVSGSPVHCVGHQSDRYGRRIMTCRTDRAGDLGRAMVTDGLAWAFLYYNTRYVVAEDGAQSARLGIWQHDCPRPVDHQQRHEPAESN